MAASWIRMIEPAHAAGRLAELYERVKTPHGTVDNVMKAHSLRPDTMEGHVVLYRSVLHSDALTLPLWFLEVVASYVSLLNGCAYSHKHHWANARRLIADPVRADAIEIALKSRSPDKAFEGKELALLRYAAKLTLQPGAMTRADWDLLEAAGCDHGEILEVNQVTGYFNYVNRHLSGLGVTTEGDVIGYYAEEGSGA